MDRVQPHKGMRVAIRASSAMEPFRNYVVYQTKIRGPAPSQRLPGTPCLERDYEIGTIYNCIMYERGRYWCRGVTARHE